MMEDKPPPMAGRSGVKYQRAGREGRAGPALREGRGLTRVNGSRPQHPGGLGHVAAGQGQAQSEPVGLGQQYPRIVRDKGSLTDRVYFGIISRSVARMRRSDRARRHHPRHSVSSNLPAYCGTSVKDRER